MDVFESVEDRMRCGRPKKTTVIEDQRIALSYKGQPFSGILSLNIMFLHQLAEFETVWTEC